eukprot:4170888-Prorocentrum_lima.AAC.1
MTSSLVGSEMCIRDSGTPLQTPTATNTTGDLKQHQHIMQRKQQRYPVSYTHLTLPTICSV